MIGKLKKNIPLIILGLLVGTCTVNAGYNAYQRKVEKKERIQSYRSLVDSLKTSYNAIAFDSVISDFKNSPTSIKQTAFNFPQNVIIEDKFKDAEIKNDTCFVYLKSQRDEAYGFILTYDRCDQLSDFMKRYGRVVAVAELTSYVYTDSSFHYNGRLLYVKKDDF